MCQVYHNCKESKRFGSSAALSSGRYELSLALAVTCRCRGARRIATALYGAR